MSEYTYYAFQDDLCGENEYDYYRVGPDGLDWGLTSYDSPVEWKPSTFASMEDLLNTSLRWGAANYREVSEDEASHG